MLAVTRSYLENFQQVLVFFSYVSCIHTSDSITSSALGGGFTVVDLTGNFRKAPIFCGR